MRNIKYIMIDYDTPILFPDHLQHIEVAAKMVYNPSQITSAGFVNIDGRDECGNPLFQVYGESVSLNIKSNEKDSSILNRTFGLMY